MGKCQCAFLVIDKTDQTLDRISNLEFISCELVKNLILS